MGISLSIWIDIDKPTKTFSIHSENRSRNPKYKGINQMFRDGGWFEVGNYDEAVDLFKEKYSDYKLNIKI